MPRAPIRGGELDYVKAQEAAGTRVERRLLSLMSGDDLTWPAASDDGDGAALLHAARYHGVAPMLDARLRSAVPSACPAAVAAALHGETLREAGHELAHRAELGRVLRALHEAGIAALLLKGTALAYSLYPRPTLRPRGDTDLLIPPDRRGDAARMLAQLGYDRSDGVQGELVSYQATWTRTDRYGATHVLDVHWRVNNSQMLAGVLGYDELAARRVPIPRLGPFAFGLCAVDALLFACIHRAGHAHAPYIVDGIPYLGGDRLIWLYDMHLLVGAMSPAELDEFAALAAARRVRAICLDGLRRSVECFGTVVPPHVMEALAAPGPGEATSHYFGGGPLRQMVGDFRALGSWRDRAGWLRETALPGEQYMRSKYPDAGLSWLPWLYVRRTFGGVWRRLVAGR